MRNLYSLNTLKLLATAVAVPGPVYSVFSLAEKGQTYGGYRCDVEKQG
jgi:hypothetical protein